MVAISIAIHPVELQPLRDFGSEADFYLPKGGNYFKVRSGVPPFIHPSKFLENIKPSYLSRIGKYEAYITWV